MANFIWNIIEYYKKNYTIVMQDSVVLIVLQNKKDRYFLFCIFLWNLIKIKICLYDNFYLKHLITFELIFIFCREISLDLYIPCTTYIFHFLFFLPFFYSSFLDSFLIFWISKIFFTGIDTKSLLRQTNFSVNTRKERFTRKGDRGQEMFW